MSEVSKSKRMLLAALVAALFAQSAIASDYDDYDQPPVRQQSQVRRANRGPIVKSNRDYNVRRAAQDQVLPQPPLPMPDVSSDGTAPASPMAGSPAPGTVMHGNAMPANGMPGSAMADDSVYQHGEGSDSMTPEQMGGHFAGGCQAGGCQPGGDCFDSCDNCGGAKGCCRCCLCGPPGRFWIRDEYLGFFAKGDHLPTLVATNPTGNLPAFVPLFGNSNVNNSYRSGNWIQGGMWLDCCRQWGLTGDYFFLGRQSTNYNASSDGDPVLARPYVDANTGGPAQQLISFPGTVVGSVSISDANSFQGAGAALRHNLCCSQCCNDCCDSCGGGNGSGRGCGRCFQGQNCARLDLLTGFRYYNFNDNLNITENLTSTSTTNGVPVGTQINVRDSFLTRNNFYGGTIGLQYDRYRGRWVTEGVAQVALGGVNQIININGNTTVMFPGQTTAVNQGGLLALSSNIGHYTHNNFAAIPMFSGRVGYRLTECLTFFVGYTFIYWGQVARAGDQIDTTVNSNLLPPSTGVGPQRPAFTLHESTLWVQGVTIGGQLNF